MGWRRGVVGVIVLVALAAPAAARADASGLVAAYGFEETAGATAVDSSSAGNAGAIAGPARVAGRFGQALSFDGVDDRVNVAAAGSLNLTTGMTLESWVNPTAASSSWRTVLLKEQTAALAYALYSDEGTGRPSAHAYTSREFDTRGVAAAALNAWTHLATTYDGATLRLYVNGTQVSSKAVTGALKTSSGALRIGGNAIWGEYFKGAIDEVRVYNRALTAAEIGSDMAAPVAAADTPPSAPGALTATGGLGKVSLSWGSATDDNGVVRYNVHRGTTPGFTPTTANRVAQPTTASYTDLVGAGTWYYRVTAEDAAGNVGPVSNEASAVATADTTPPTVSLDGACPRTVATTANVSGTRSDDSGEAPAISLRLSGDGRVMSWPATASAGQYRLDWDTVYTDNGTYTLTVVASDKAGNEAVSDPCEVTVDNVPRSVGFTAPADGATVSGTVPVRAESRQGGVVGGAFTRIRLDGQEVALVAAGVATYDWATRSYANGSTHTLTAEMLGNYPADPPYRVTTIHVTVDNADHAPPSPPVLWGAADSAGDVHLSFDGDPDVNAFVLYRSSTPGFVPGDANLVRAYPYRQVTDSGRPTGTWYYKAVAVDDAGNRSAPSNEITVVVAPDTEPPNPVYIDSACGSLSGTVSVVGKALDNRFVAYLQLELDGEPLGSPVSATSSGLLTATTSWDTRTATNGPHVLKAVARDADGNETISAPCAVTVRNTAPPAVTVTAPADGATVSGSAVALTANATDDVAVASVQFRIDGVAVGGTDTTAPYTAAWNTTAATNGPHAITAVARDFDGNATTSAPVGVTVSNAPSGLVAAYGFEEASGTTVADASGKGNTGTVSGATPGVAGKFGRALSFDGVNDYVSVADADVLDLASALTLEAWVKPTTVSGSWRTAVMKERPGGLAYALYAAADNGRASANLWAGGRETEARAPAATPTAAWTHLAVTYDSLAVGLYVNGSQVASAPLTSPVTVSTGALKIGGNAVWPEWFKGLVDEVRVYSRALTAAEVAADRDRPVAP